MDTQIEGQLLEILHNFVYLFLALAGPVVLAFGRKWARSLIDAKRADLLDRLAAGALEDVLARYPDLPYHELLERVVEELRKGSATPTANVAVLTRVSASSIRNAWKLSRCSPPVPPAAVPPGE